MERKTLTAVLMQRCDEDEADGGWRVAGFGDTAEEDYLTHKADEDDDDRGNLVLFKFFKMELYQGGRWVVLCVNPLEDRSCAMCIVLSGNGGLWMGYVEENP